MPRLNIILLASLLLTACGKDNDYVYKQSSIDPISVAETHAVVGNGGQVDIVWVIDNSGSMADIQADVVANANLFMREFSQYGALDWRLILLSTSEQEGPYLGLPLSYGVNTPDFLTVFQTAVARLGTDGDATEKEFTPVLDKFHEYPLALRANAHLVLIFVTDEEEQSEISAQDFLAQVVAMKHGRQELVHAYGAYKAKDFGCDNALVYAGSPFEQLITATGGSAYSTCSPNFGGQLADLGRGIVSAVASSVILLKQRPQPTSIRVTYKGDVLPGGPLSEGGKWMYDPTVNGVRFHDLLFVDFDVKDIHIEYLVDQGE